jgi:alcohol dehydrogenase (cytochrome c)
MELPKRLALVLASLVASAAMAAAPGLDGPSDSSDSSGTEWLSYNKTLNGQRYSTLAEINVQNVGTLKETCRLQIDRHGSFEAGPVVVNGLMYVTTSLKTVALDASNCSKKWEYTYSPEQSEVFPVNRGVAYLNGTIFRGTADARLLALDAATGKLLWSDVVGDADIGEYISGAPLAWNGLIFVGTAGSEVGIKGRMCAYDALTGREVWRFDLIPTGREVGAETWKLKKWAQHGGGGTWSHFALDPVAREIFIPVGNPVPDFSPADRPGANLFTDSVVVLDALNGGLKWWYQVVPHDGADFDLAAAPMLYRDVQERDLVALAGKDGYIQVVDRSTHKLVFKTAVTTIKNEGKIPSAEGTLLCPGALGGVEWNGAAFDRETHVIAAGSVDYCNVLKPAHIEFKTGELLYGGTWELAKDPAAGWVTAIDSDSGKIRWKYHTDTPVVAGVTMTAGGLTFTGDNDGNFYAFDTRSGKVLAKKATGGSLSGGVVTYAEGGKQYIAFTSGNISRSAFGAVGRPTVIVMDVTASQVASGSGTEANASRGAQVYRTTCGGCHGASGTNVAGHSLQGLNARMNADQLAAWILNPAPPMPHTFATPLDSDDERDVRDLVAYVLAHFAR